MVFKTTGNKSNSVILFFHAMGVTGKAVCRLQRKWQKNIIALCQHQLCIAPDRGIKAKEMRYNRLYDFWRNMESKK